MENNHQPSTDNNIDININSDADIPGNTHLSNPDENGLSSTEVLENELQEQKDKYLRLFAEFDNYKRRTAKERVELIQTAGKEILLSMLEVLDDCDRAENQIEKSEDLEQVKGGVKLVFNKLKSVLTQKGLQPVQSLDTDFDVEKHEAISEIEAGEEKKGKVVDEIEKGYTLNGKQIRFAKVVVGK
ncbi:MAG TPA: nucleotide exchange factor GrpE [Ferruginibacter sp.]|nr:nucleotide exchange factor GrpE [Ferruginibacter sp.]